MKTYIEQPALYIDYLQHIERSVGVTYDFLGFEEIGLDNRDFYGLRPSGSHKRVVINPAGASFVINFNNPIPAKFLNGINYIALFGHNFASQQIAWSLNAIDMDDEQHQFYMSEGINSGVISSNLDESSEMQYDNFSIIRTAPLLPNTKLIKELQFHVSAPAESFEDFQLTMDIASISIGRSFTFPHSVDLSSSAGFFHDGIDIKSTAMGRELIQSKWTHQPNHGDFIPFQLYHPYGQMPNLDIARRSGRAEFQFQVSYLDDTDLIPTFKLPHDTVGTDIAYGMTDVLSDTMADGTISEHGMLGTILNTFTYGGQLPMMLCANVNNKHVNGWGKTDEFYIVRSSDDGFDFKPVAPDLYNISFKLVETW